MNKQIRQKEHPTIRDTPTTSFETIEIATVGTFKILNQYRFILTIQNVFTKYIVEHPIINQDAKTIAYTLVNQFILKYGFSQF